MNHKYIIIALSWCKISLLQIATASLPNTLISLMGLTCSNEILIIQINEWMKNPYWCIQLFFNRLTHMRSIGPSTRSMGAKAFLRTTWRKPLLRLKKCAIFSAWRELQSRDLNPWTGPLSTTLQTSPLLVGRGERYGIGWLIDWWVCWFGWLVNWLFDRKFTTWALSKKKNNLCVSSMSPLLSSTQACMLPCPETSSW